MEGLSNIIFNKAIIVLVKFEDGIISSELAKKTGITYSHVSKLVKLMINYNLMESMDGKNRRIKQLKLTDKGKEFQTYSKKIFFIIKEFEKEKALKQSFNKKIEKQIPLRKKIKTKNGGKKQWKKR